ncbi:MAG: winged helix DNA-binding protein [Sphingorhabdus sp.]
MLLDLFAAKIEQTDASVSSLCIASGVPATTALRWIRHLVDAGLFERVNDEDDRRPFIRLSEHGLNTMADYFQTIAEQAPLAVWVRQDRPQNVGSWPPHPHPKKIKNRPKGKTTPFV